MPVDPQLWIVRATSPDGRYAEAVTVARTEAAALLHALGLFPPRTWRLSAIPSPTPIVLLTPPPKE